MSRELAAFARLVIAEPFWKTHLADHLCSTHKLYNVLSRNSSLSRPR